MNRVKVSVVTICFNEEKKIRKTMESVLKQTYENVEYIIKDGVSTDNTNVTIDAILSDYEGKNVRHIIKLDDGIYDAMNQAISECQGEWIIFINAGDYLATNDILKDIFDKDISERIDILYGNVITKDFSGESVWIADINKLPYKMPFSHQACFIRTKIAKELEFDVDYRIVADYEMILRCYERGCLFQNVNNIIAVFELDGVSSQNYLEKNKEHYQVLSNHKIMNTKLILKYPCEMCLAWIKSFIDKHVSMRMQINLRKLYKTRIKGYVNAREVLK